MPRREGEQGVQQVRRADASTKTEDHTTRQVFAVGRQALDVLIAHEVHNELGVADVDGTIGVVDEEKRIGAIAGRAGTARRL